MYHAYTHRCIIRTRVLCVVRHGDCLLLQIPVVVRAVAARARALVAVVVHHFAAIPGSIGRPAVAGAHAHLRQLPARVVSQLVEERRIRAKLLFAHAAGRVVNNPTRVSQCRAVAQVARHTGQASRAVEKALAF
jgi:hypothetical protein